jgi:hypothetical protein
MPRHARQDFDHGKYAADQHSGESDALPGLHV